MRICKTSIVFDQNKRALDREITAESPLALAHNGVASETQADILLKLDTNGELVILKNSDKHIALERAGRRITLASRPLRVCEKDIIHIGESKLSIARSTFAVTKPSRKFGTASRVLAASAALCSLAFTACDDGCENGQTKCDKNAIYECKDNSWTLKEKCEGDLDPECRMYDNQAECVPTRTSGVAEPPDECVDGQSKCDDNAVYECQNAEWTLKEKCESPSECTMNDNKAVCVEVTREEGEMLPPDE